MSRETSNGYWNGSPPVRPEPWFTYRVFSKDAEIVRTNALVKDICEKRGIKYLDVYSALVRDDGKLESEYTNDGLHLMMSGYEVWKKVIEKYVR